GGDAMAVTTANAGASLTAEAIAHGGQGATLAGHATAKTKASGLSGTFSAIADTSLKAGQLIQTASASSGGSVDGFSKAKARVVVGGPSLAFQSRSQSLAFETGAPDAASTNAVLAANPNIAAAFGASPTFFAIGELGGSYSVNGTSSQTTTETLNLTVDLTRLASRQDLVAGFYNATAVGPGFVTLTFDLSADGNSVVHKTFTTVAAAQTFFTDHAKDLGALSTGALSGNILTLQASFSLTTATANSGFYAQLIIGDPPNASHAAPTHRFAEAMAGLGGKAGGSLLANAPARQLAQPRLLSSGSHQLA
ncbi:MAG: hypothetical protein ACYC8V_03915, partial [Caulobacteraceae bacterium]